MQRIKWNKGTFATPREENVSYYIGGEFRQLLKQDKYRIAWIENQMYIHFNHGKWHTAQSIDFNFIQS